MRELRAQENQFEGTIPEELYNNVNLEVLRLDSNQFSGTISTKIENFAGLYELRLNNNTLTGAIPFTFYRLSQLRKSEIVIMRIGSSKPHLIFFT